MKKVVQVDIIDQAKVDEIKSAHADLSKSNDREKILHLDLTNTTGNTELASKAAEILHSDASIIPETEASGNLDTSGTVLFAAGHDRTARPNASFILNEVGPYTPETKAEDLEGTDSEVYHLMLEMGCAKLKTLENIKSGEKFSATAAEKMKLVHEITGFKNAFASPKRISRKGKKRSSEVNSNNETEVSKSTDIPSHEQEQSSKRIASKRIKSDNETRTLRGRKTN